MLMRDLFAAANLVVYLFLTLLTDRYRQFGMTITCLFTDYM